MFLLSNAGEIQPLFIFSLIHQGLSLIELIQLESNPSGQPGRKTKAYMSFSKFIAHYAA
tara:strand:+ start:441 stop:617 length:177 start_codon:yes stop_codon:yes gene_type:complete